MLVYFITLTRRGEVKTLEKTVFVVRSKKLRCDENTEDGDK